MATHFSILAWKTPWTEQPGRLQSMGSELDTTERLSSLACTQIPFLKIIDRNVLLNQILFNQKRKKISFSLPQCQVIAYCTEIGKKICFYLSGKNN